MYVTAEIIREVEQQYGIPVEIAREYEMTAEQLDVVRLGMRHGRCHDVTLVIVDDERNIVVTRKPSYPPGAFRTPSGGVEVGESFDDGAIREAKEETGLDIVLEKYLIRANVRFRRLGFHPDQILLDRSGRDGIPTYDSSEVIDWTTHVLQARPIGGTLQPLDTKEIVEARKATITEITGPIREALLASGKPGLRYRAELDGLAMELIGGNATTESKPETKPQESDTLEQSIAGELWRWAFESPKAQADITAVRSSLLVALEFYLCGAFHLIDFTRARGIWCDGVIELAISRLDRQAFLLSGVGYFPNELAPFEIEFHFARRRDRQPTRTIIRLGWADSEGEIRWKTKKRNVSGISTSHPTSLKDWAVAVEVTPGETQER